MAKNYALSSCEDLIERYVVEYKGDAHIIREGVLGLGTIVLTNGVTESGAKLKSIIITEYYINAWQSGHKVRKYNKLPNKYQTEIDKL